MSTSRRSCQTAGMPPRRQWQPPRPRSQPTAPKPPAADPTTDPHDSGDQSAVVDRRRPARRRRAACKARPGPTRCRLCRTGPRAAGRHRERASRKHPGRDASSAGGGAATPAGSGGGSGLSEVAMAPLPFVSSGLSGSRDCNAPAGRGHHHWPAIHVASSFVLVPRSPAKSASGMPVAHEHAGCMARRGSPRPLRLFLSCSFPRPLGIGAAW